MNRRGFFGALAGLLASAKLVKAAPPAPVPGRISAVAYMRNMRAMGRAAGESINRIILNALKGESS